MTDTENVFDGFALLGDDEEFDVDKIFGSGSDEPAPPPPAPTLAEEVKSQPEPEQVQTVMLMRLGVSVCCMTVLMMQPLSFSPSRAVRT